MLLSSCRKMNRRGLLVGLGSLIAAPAVVRAASLMPVRRPALITPTWTAISLPDYCQKEDLPEFVALPIYAGTIGAFRGIRIREMTPHRSPQDFPVIPLPHSPAS